MKDAAFTAEKKYTVSSYFEGVEDGHAVGWALLKEVPSYRLKVDIICQGAIVASGIANVHRSDLEEQKIGDGLHLFKLPISDELFNNQSHIITAKISGTAISIPGGARKTGRLPRKRDYPTLPRAEGLLSLKSILPDSTSVAAQAKQDKYVQAYTTGALLQETGLYTESSQIWSAFEKALGKTSLISYKLGEAKLLQGEDLAAKEHFLETINLQSSFPWGHIGLGNFFFKARKFAQAEKYYKCACLNNDIMSIFDTYASNVDEMKILTESNDMLTEKKFENALKLLSDRLFLQPYSAVIERKYNETLCLLKIPEDTHLDIVVKVNTKSKLMRLYNSIIEAI